MVSRIRQKIQPETKPENFKPEVDRPSGTSLLGNDVAADKLRGLIDHGIRYVMLPLHLFHLCVFGSSAASSSKTKDNLSSSPKLRENKNKPSISSSAKKSQQRTLAPSPTSSTSGFSSCSSTSSKTSGVARIVDPPTSSSAPTDVPKIAKASSSSTSSSTSGRLPVEQPSPTNRPAPVPRRIFQDIATDESSDEMVTADECFDDSSNDRWSSAESSPSMNMSIDFDGCIGHFEKISANRTDDDCSAEEPMEVSMEESSLNPTKSILNRSPYRGFRLDSPRSKLVKGSYRMSSSFGSGETGSSCREDFSNSSADREIAGIFQRASTSPSSSEDEVPDRLSGRSNNPFAKDDELQRSRHREELCDATIRKKRTTPTYQDQPRDLSGRRVDRRTPENPRSADRSLTSSRTRQPLERTNAKRIIVDSARINDQTDSAYSDEDVEMNTIESINHHLQSFAMQSLQESVIEWMDQDLDYVADTEDSNDASPLAASSKVSSNGPNPRSRFGELDGLPVERKSTSPEIERRFALDGSLIANGIAAPEVVEITDRSKKTPRPMGASEVDETINRSKKTPMSMAAPEVGDHPKKTSRTMAAPEVGETLNQSKKTPRPTASPDVERRSDQWRKNFGRDESEIRGIPGSAQNPSTTNCHCGNPKCLYVPVAVPIDASSMTTWAINDYSRAQSPLGRASSVHHKYPEFFIPTAETMSDKKIPYVLVPANFVLPC